MTATSKDGIDRRTVLATGVLGGAASSVGLAGPVLAQATPDAAAPAPAAAPPASAVFAAKAVDSTRDVILRISREVWANAEGLFAEEKSAAIHVRELKAAGFKVAT